MNIEPIGHYHCPLKEKFGIPRQSGLAADLKGRIVLEGRYTAEAVRGLEGFSHVWLIWGFHLNNPDAAERMTVRPPRLGGNESMGVFATRSPYRPNKMGLSAVRLTGIDTTEGIVLNVSGADLADGTPIYDIKPYLPYSDSIPDASSGFVGKSGWKRLSAVIPEEMKKEISPEDLKAISELIEEDPRPGYQNDPQRMYGLSYGSLNIRFRVEDGKAYVMPSAPAGGQP